MQMTNSAIIDVPHVIRPYICSAFINLQPEISYLLSNTFIKLDELCQSYGHYFKPLNTKSTSYNFELTSNLVLSHSLECIQECCPFFICIIKGGSSCEEELIPSVDDQVTFIQKNIKEAVRSGHSWLKKKESPFFSLLRAEVEAALFHTVPCHKFFYIQKSTSKSQNVSETHEDEIENLKKYLINKKFQVKFFSDKFELGEEIYNDWSKLIISLMNQSHIIKIEGDLILQQNLEIEATNKRLLSNYILYPAAKQLATEILYELRQFWKNYSKIEKLEERRLEDDEDFLNGDKLGDGIFSSSKSLVSEALSCKKSAMKKINCEEKRIIVISGETGSGKTSFLAYLLQQMREETKNEILIIRESASIFQLNYILCRIIKQIRKKFWNKKCPIQEEFDDIRNFNSIRETFISCINLIPCIIILDALDQLQPSIDQEVRSVKELSWLPTHLPPSCRLLIATKKFDLIHKSLRCRSDTIFFALPELDATSLANLISTPSSGHHQLVPIPESIQRCSKFGKRPLVLACASSLLHLDDVITHRNTSDLWHLFFVAISNKLSWSRSPSSGIPHDSNNISGWVRDVLKLLVSSRHGLSRDELLEMLTLIGYCGKRSVTSFDWQLFERASRPLLHATSGGHFIRFVNRDVEDSLRNLLFGFQAFDIDKLRAQLRHHSFIASYLRNFTSIQRQILELPWQLMKARDWRALCDVMSEPRFFLGMCEECRHDQIYLNEVICLWRLLRRHHFHLATSLHQMIIDAGKGIKVEAEIQLLIPEEISSDEELTKNRSPIHSKPLMKLDETDVLKLKIFSAWFLFKNDQIYLQDSIKITNDIRNWLIENISPFSYQCVLQIFLASLESQIGIQREVDVFIRSLQMCKEDLMSSLRLSRQERKTLMHSKGNIHLHIAHMLLNKVGYDVTPQLRHHLIVSRVSHPFDVISRLLQRARDVFEKCDSISGLARTISAIAQLTIRSGATDRVAEELNTSMTSLMMWHGLHHVNVAEVFEVYGGYYQQQRNRGRRRALLAYKEALSIYKVNERRKDVARVLAIMGSLLHQEGTRRSNSEAAECLSRSQDIIILQKSSHITAINSEYKRVMTDMTTGRYEYGHAKLPGNRSFQRPISSYNTNRLQQQLKLSLRNCFLERSTQSATSKSILNRSYNRPYSPYYLQTFRNKTLIIPQHTRTPNSSFNQDSVSDEDHKQVERSEIRLPTNLLKKKSSDLKLEKGKMLITDH